MPLSLMLSATMLRKNYSTACLSVWFVFVMISHELYASGATDGIGSCGGRGVDRLPAKPLHFRQTGVAQLHWSQVDSWYQLPNCRTRNFCCSRRQIRLVWVAVFLVSRLPQAAANVVAEGFLEGWEWMNSQNYGEGKSDVHRRQHCSSDFMGGHRDFSWAVRATLYTQLLGMHRSQSISQ